MDEAVRGMSDILEKKEREPYVTFSHWDTPQALEDKYVGFLSPKIVVQGYDMGTMVAGRISTVVNDPHQPKNTGATEVYTVRHRDGNGPGRLGRISILHPSTAIPSQASFIACSCSSKKSIQGKYQACQGGKIGITLVSHWFEPYSSSEADQIATKRNLDFMLGWVKDPVTNDDYPRNMHDFVGGRLPKFTSEESKMLKGSYDFFGLNYYTTYYAQNIDANFQSVRFMSDASANRTDREIEFQQAHIRVGVDDANNNASSLEEALNDLSMVSTLRGFLLGHLWTNSNGEVVTP
ncbi:unnamed protein product [Dovyalis caffra]|uniref:Uncharacterized protein n=1 Tax=Dovyalis caffra TaxID=77055 RepID=A0AAV1RBV5_9ROSI|nr:unnamed protein product [Dovyalis caffra]